MPLLITTLNYFNNYTKNIFNGFSVNTLHSLTLPVDK